MLDPNGGGAPEAPSMRRRRGGKRMAAHVLDLEDDLSLLREPLEQLAERAQQVMIDFGQPVFRCWCLSVCLSVYPPLKLCIEQVKEIYEFEAKHRTFGLMGVNDNEDSSKLLVQCKMVFSSESRSPVHGHSND